MKLHLLAIDVQNDFCDPKGSLFVPGADQDMNNLANLINRLGSKIDDVHVTLDSHRTVDIAHPIFWTNSKGEHPNPFTIISKDDVIKGVWTTTNPAWKQRAMDYVTQLETNQRYPLCIWPPHTLIGSWGHCVYQSVSNALTTWENNTFGVIDFVTKGSNIMTEHYSAYKADVPDPSDPSTMANTGLLEILQEADEILIAGEALSHCVRNTVLDIMDDFGDENVKKFTFLKDCSSSVPGFENLGQEFIDIGSSKGMNIIDSTDYLK